MKCNASVQSLQPLSILIPKSPRSLLLDQGLSKDFSSAGKPVTEAFQNCQKTPENPLGTILQPALIGYQFRLMASSRQQRDIRHAPTAILMRSLLKFNIIAKNPVGQEGKS